MGETPEVVKIACPGCETQFRLKPKKGRLPDRPVPCPKCGESIPIVEENIRRDGRPKAPSVPQARAFSKSRNEQTTKTPNASLGDSEADTSTRSDHGSSDEDEFDHIAVSPGLSKSNPKSTFLGMGSALAAIEGPGKRDDKTAVVDDNLLAKIRSESSVAEEDDDEQDGKELGKIPKQADVFKRETSENKAVGPEELARRLEQTEEEDDEDLTKEMQAPGQMVLGKIKLKKKLKRTLKKTVKTKPSGQKAGARSPSKPTVSEETTGSSSTSKPSLSSLLKKARQKKDTLDISSPDSNADQHKTADQESSEKLDRALDDLAKETARSISEHGADAEPPAFDSGDSSMIDMLRRRVAENQQPGAASERRGSGYIRLPTAEIQDVLGHGTYRLRVEDIIYEPIDKEGLTQLVKRGVLLGAEEIAEPDGDWMPIADHPVFLELRRKMAREAHDLLKKYKPKTDTVEDADLPGRVDELPGRVDELPRKQDDDELPEIEAELEQEAEQAANELFGNIDEDDAPAASSTPPPKPESSSRKPARDIRRAGRSIELDYEALGVDESDVEVAEANAPSSDEADPAPPAGSAMRTWLPLIAATAVLVALAGVAFSPLGRPYLESILGDQAAKNSASVKPPAKAAAVEKEDEEQPASATTGEAIATASSTLSAALDVDPNDAQLQEKIANELAQAGDYAAAARVMGVLWSERGDDADFAANYADVLLQAGHFAAARQVALDGLQMETDAHDFAQVFAQAIEKNPALGAAETVEITEQMADAASVKTEGKRLVVHLSRDGAPGYEFKPSQSGWERGWRTSVASYRLCQIMVCNFEIPRSRPGRIEKATFDALTASADPASTAQLAWVTEDGKQYLYGALQDAVGGAARFPIEATELWRGWLSTNGESDMAETPATKALAGLKGHPAGFYEPLADQLDETSLQRLAAHLSSVLVFDFLTNNWSRFQSGEENWGTHLHVIDGALVSMHNGNAFQPRASTRIKGRFSWTSRFSKDTIASLRLMKPEVVSEKLFPNATAGEKARLEVFWSQRDAVLERIDKLQKAHGAKEALAFE